MANRFSWKNKLREVTIKGYKSIAFDNPVTLKLGDVNILLGANGAGKSNIISFFKMLSYMMSKSFGRYVEMAGTANSLLHYGAKKTPSMSGILKFADNNSIDTYQFSLANAAPDRLIITEERINWHRNGKTKPYEVSLEPNFKVEHVDADKYDANRFALDTQKLYALIGDYDFTPFAKGFEITYHWTKKSLVYG